MLATLIQIAVAALWGIVLASHICRLARLAYVAEVHATLEPYLRRYAQRMWCGWAGRSSGAKSNSIPAAAWRLRCWRSCWRSGCDGVCAVLSTAA
jgi:hypothetical protein